MATQIGEEGQPEATRQATPEGGYAPVSGLDRASKEARGVLEAQAAAKTASDYVHVIWAYGVLWAIFAGYGLFLWRQGVRLRDDARVLREEIQKRSA